MTNTDVGEAIQNIRLSHKLTQLEFSEMLGTPVQEIDKIEQGLIQANLTLLKLIKILFDLPDDYFHLDCIGSKIQNIRCFNNLSQSEFAKKLGITKNKINEIEQGFQEPDNTLLILIETLFDLPNGFFQTNK